MSLALACLLSGCAGDYVSRTRDIRRAYEASDHEKALAILEKQQKEAKDIDRLLYLLDQGMILHAGGKDEASIRVLTEAEKLAAQLDATSISEEAKTFLSNERERAYRGEDFEKLMINVLLALGYARLGRDEDALVEVRRVNERLRKMINDEKKPYQQLAIARYVAGVLWEDQRELDSAAIDYQAAFEQAPELGHLAESLLALAKETGRDTLFEQLKKRYPDVEPRPYPKDEGQIVVVVEAGLSPEKINTSRQMDGSEGINLIAVPVYRGRWRPSSAKVSVGDVSQRAVTLTSIDDVAKVHLDHRVGQMVAKQVAAMAVKAGAATAIGAATDSAELGALAFLLMNVNNQPDLRAWMSLPAEFQVARFRVPAGKHEVVVDSGGQRTVHTVEVAPRRIGLLVVRRYQ